MPAQAHKKEDAAQHAEEASASASVDETADKVTIRRPARLQLSAEETRKRMEAFETEREEAFVAAIREDAS